MRKTTKLNIFKTILLIAVLVFGIFVVHYVWTTTPNSKLEIAALLELNDVNLKTIDKDMTCTVNTDGEIRIIYKGQIVYQTYVSDDEVNVFYGSTDVMTDDVPGKGMTYEITRPENEDDMQIKEYVEHITNIFDRIVSIFGTIISVIITEFFIYFGCKEIELDQQLDKE
ncbi:unknown [Clostridium sp. CAG:492]|nr:unknown [Clostridium sp. CAG:492]